MLLSCGNASEEEQSSESLNDASIIFGKSDYSIPVLSAPAKEHAIKWGVLEDFLYETKNSNGSNFEALRNSSERLEEYADSLFKNIPDTLNTQSIQSRLMVIKTRTALLYQTAHQARIDSLKLQGAMNELNTSVENFIVQLNEKFQKDNIDLLRKEDEHAELQKQKRFSDSVYNIELQDKKNKTL